ncbi:hypothetical protein NL676_030709 [Syzygium grande]|nr:hypothetical protein NL676_030709 [Syzygium grande]
MVMDIVDKLFVTMFDSLNASCKRELEAIGRQYPFEPLKYLRKTLRLSFQEDVQMLKKNSLEQFCVNYANERDCGAMEDMATDDGNGPEEISFPKLQLSILNGLPRLESFSPMNCTFKFPITSAYYYDAVPQEEYILQGCLEDTKARWNAGNQSDEKSARPIQKKLHSSSSAFLDHHLAHSGVSPWLVAGGRHLRILTVPVLVKSGLPLKFVSAVMIGLTLKCCSPTLFFAYDLH